MLLTNGTCERLLQGKSKGIGSIVQYIGMERVPAEDSSTLAQRYRITISDGQMCLRVMVSPFLNDLIEKNMMRVLDVIQIVDTLRCSRAGHAVVIVTQLSVIGSAYEQVGFPRMLNTIVDEINSEDVLEPERSSPPIASSAPPTIHSVPSSPLANRTTRSERVTDAASKAPYAAAADKRKETKKREDAYEKRMLDKLYPGMNGRWQVMVRVVRNSGRMVGRMDETRVRSLLTVMDASGKMTISAWTGPAIILTDTMQIGKVYTVSNAQIIKPPKQYTVGDIRYQIKITSASRVKEVLDDGTVPNLTFDPLPIGELKTCSAGSCDVVSIINRVSGLLKVTKRSESLREWCSSVEEDSYGPQDDAVLLCECTVVDNSGYSCRVALWNKDAETFEGKVGDVLMLKDARITTFAGVSLTTGDGTGFLVNPPIPATRAMKDWFRVKGQFCTFTELSDAAFGACSSRQASSTVGERGLLTVSEAVAEEIGADTVWESFKTRAKLRSVQTSKIAYEACTQEGCNGGVEKVDDHFKCRACRATVAETRYCYRLNVIITDGNDEISATMFDQVGENLLGIPADEMEDYRINQKSEYNRLIQRVLDWYMFTVQARTSTDTGLIMYNIVYCER
ncbi:hypothetical protein CALVIDRAFT_562175 [Calocera viscosa TUFC12733]|uniref:Replication protein A subunit n=1 Tax=Calocera viscosa (strain TUFC12733) TaxID=1330018 RepID=A0A167NZE9_CALVF|nr:hypothetical protein CALVIDRAFT_562175 [Calocera viscosa TUFC12733]